MPACVTAVVCNPFEEGTFIEEDILCLPYTSEISSTGRVCDADFKTVVTFIVAIMALELGQL